MTEKPSYWGDALQEIVYCIDKNGGYRLDNEDRTRLIATTSNFGELKVLLALFAIEPEVFNDIDHVSLRRVGSFMNTEIPLTDRMLRWPWDEGYEADT